MKNHGDFVGPPPAVIPKEKLFKAELLGLDYQNYMYIRLYEPSNEGNYSRLKLLLDCENSNCFKRPIPEDKICTGLIVVIKEELQFYRARVQSKDDVGMVHCFKIDEGISSIVLAGNVFPASQDDLEIPIIALKCRLEGLELFNNLPNLKMAYQLIKMGELDNESHYKAEVMSMTDGVPVVRMTMHGISLTSKIQRWIPTLSALPTLQAGVPIEAKIVHADSKGFIWFHCLGSEDLLLRIQETLQNIDLLHYSSTPYPGVLVDELWKQKYFEVPTGIFISKFINDEDFYRVKLTKAISKKKVEVEFIDYGNKGIVDRKALMYARDIDENLAFIPPQCVKAHLIGFNRIDLDYFWSLIPSVLDIVVIDQHDPDAGLEVELFNISTNVSINEMWKSCSASKLKYFDLNPEFQTLKIESINENSGEYKNNINFSDQTSMDLKIQEADRLDTSKENEDNGEIIQVTIQEFFKTLSVRNQKVIRNANDSGIDDYRESGVKAVMKIENENKAKNQEENEPSQMCLETLDSTCKELRVSV